MVLVGRLDRAGKLLSTGVYTSPSIIFSRPEIQPAEGTAVAGAGWRPGAEVTLRQPGESEIVVAADSNGKVSAVLPGRAHFIIATSAGAEAAARRLKNGD